VATLISTRPVQGLQISRCGGRETKLSTVHSDESLVVLTVSVFGMHGRIMFECMVLELLLGCMVLELCWRLSYSCLDDLPCFRRAFRLSLSLFDRFDVLSPSADSKLPNFGKIK
jgi:hypothetical protein